MPSKTMRNIVTQVKKLRETMESILSSHQLEVRRVHALSVLGFNLASDAAPPGHHV